MRASKPEYITLKYTVFTLDNIIRVLLQKPDIRNYVDAINNLVSELEPSTYITDPEKSLRITMIKKIINIIKEFNLRNRNDILELIDSSLQGANFEGLDNMLRLILSTPELTEHEISVTVATVTSTLKNKVLDRFVDGVRSVAEDIESETFDDYNDAYHEVGSLAAKIDKEYRKLNNVVTDSKYVINLNDMDDLRNNCNVARDKALNPSYKVKTSSQQMNESLAGGYEDGRVYVYGGAAKSGKSIKLLSDAKDGKMCNTYTCRDSTKTPCVVYLSMENTSNETFDRLLAYLYGNKFNAGSYTTDDLVNGFKRAKLSTPDIPGSTELIIMFKPNRSISTRDLYDIVDELEADGKEVKLFVLDYILRIRSEEKAENRYIELSNVVNELSMLAKVKEFPVVTAAQLNRDAYRSLDEAADVTTKVERAFRLSSSQMGDSIDVTRNADVIIMLHTVKGMVSGGGTMSDYTERYMAFNITEKRIGGSDIERFVIPYEYDNDLKLQEDYDMTKTIQGPKKSFTEFEFVTTRRERELVGGPGVNTHKDNNVIGGRVLKK